MPLDDTNGPARFRARYRMETAFPVADTAAVMAGEQSTGTFLKLAGEADPLVARQAAPVEDLTTQDEM